MLKTNEVYNMDCMEGIKLLDDKSIDEENMESEEKLHEIFSDPKLYKIIKALPFDEKRVLFYLLIKNKTIYKWKKKNCENRQRIWIHETST